MKNYLARLALVAVVGIAGAGFVAADQFDKKTTITIDEAVQLPNATLQPGTYVIKLFRTDVVNRNTVQFFDKGGKHLVTTVVAFPNLRLRPTGKTAFAFWEVPAGQPKALRAWFYPGEEFGQEFAYPKTEASSITASNSGATVPISEDKASDLAANVPAEPEASTIVATAEPEPAPVATPEPTPAPVEVAAAPQEPPAPVVIREEPAQQAPPVIDNTDAQRVSTAAAPDALPQTASNLPLLGLFGLLSLVSALALNLAYYRG
jgi:hypothetical protein